MSRQNSNLPFLAGCACSLVWALGCAATTLAQDLDQQQFEHTQRSQAVPEALRTGDIDAARRALGEAADLSQSESLPEDFLQNPATLVVDPVAKPARHVLSELIGDAVIAENVKQVRRQAARLSDADRFEFLCNWILPGEGHPDFRVAGEWTPTDPSPLAVEMERVSMRRPATAMSDSKRGAEIVSPVFDLLDLAAEMGKLEELGDRISGIQADDEFSQRSKAALLALVHLELQELEAAEIELGKLERLLETTPNGLQDPWPETLVVYRGTHQFSTSQGVGYLLKLLYSQYTLRQHPAPIEQWHRQIASLMNRYWHLQRGGSLETFDMQDDLGPWIPVVHTTAATRGAGYPHPRWHRHSDNEVHHLAGHHEEYLFYPIPMYGDFQLEADIDASGTTQAFAAGSFYGPKAEPDQLETGTFRGGARIQAFDPPFDKHGSWMRFRAVIADRRCQVFLNGRLVHQEQLSENHDPWIGFRSWWRNTARFRDVRITGNPEIPDTVIMSASSELVGWLPYHEEMVGSGGADWQWVDEPASGGQIVGRQRATIRGSHHESLLRYHRPLIEDGSIEYEFFYEPGRIEVHPALDRLAFVLDRDGVCVHWITDGRFDRTEVPPDNSIEEPQNRRGPATLPLQQGQWNRVRLSLVGDTAMLELNDQMIYERVLEPNNARTFGLFHFADRTESRVRNVVMRGDWPKSLPPIHEQELADDTVVALNRDLPKLQSVFTHDFAEEGLPERFFRIDGSQASAQSSGIQTATWSSEDWSQVAIMLRFALRGDFDIEARFDQLQVQGCEKEGGICLFSKIQDPQAHQLRLVRGKLGNNGEAVNGQLSIAHQGTRHFVNSLVADEATSGRLRIARRGDKLYSLFAQGDSTEFRLVAEQTATAGDIPSEGVQLVVLAWGAGRASAVWKDLTVRAERMMLVPQGGEGGEGPGELCVMKADGSQVRVVTEALPGFTHVGSPEWSSDSTKIAMDMSRGSTTGSHIVLIDADGNNLRDLGPGCMPSFSPDGKRIVFSQPGQGIVMMDSDGTRREVIDRRGWGVQWSPDGKFLAYGRSGNIVLLTVDNRDERLLLAGDQATRYSSIYWNLGWSHDSRSIAFKGSTQTGEQEVAVVDIGLPTEFQVLYNGSAYVNADFTWSPDNRQVLFSMDESGYDGPKLFLVDRTASRAPRLFSVQPVERNIFNCAWSPDGEHIAFSSQPLPKPLEWPVRMEAK